MEATTMTTNTQYSLKPITLALAVSFAATFVTVSASAADTQNTEVIGVSQYQDWSDPAMAGIAVNSGRALINHLLSASALLDTGSITQARSALLTSREFADSLGRVMPYLLVTQDIMDVNNHIVQGSVDVQSTDFLPIYGSLDDLAIYAPKVAQKARGMVKQAERHVVAGDKKQAARVLKQAADVITEDTVYLPVKYVDQQVHVALLALNQSNPDVSIAKTAVHNALSSVTDVVDTAVETPAG
jgi:hypothetical protein